MKNKTQIIITDLDKSLLNNECQITEYTKKIFGKCIEMGIIVVFATARPLRATKIFYDSILPHAVICHNGAVAYVSEKQIFQSGIKTNVTKNLLENVIKNNTYGNLIDIYKVEIIARVLFEEADIIVMENGMNITSFEYYKKSMELLLKLFQETGINRYCNYIEKIIIILENYETEDELKIKIPNYFSIKQNIKNTMNKTDNYYQRQEKIFIYQNALESVQQQIEAEKQGLVLDSGTLRPDIINKTNIDELEMRVQEYKIKIANLQEKIRIDLLKLS